VAAPVATPQTVAALCARLGLPGPTQGAEVVLAAIRPLHEAGPTDLSFLDNAAYKAQAAATKAGAVLVRQSEVALLPSGSIPIVCPQPYVAYARALQIFYPTPAVAGGISQFAVVSSKAVVHPTARIEPYAVIYAGAEVGEGAYIGAHTVVGEGVVVGKGTRVGAHATLERCQVGEDCLIHSGVRIGQDGFGFAQSGEELIKILHLGKVQIGHRVEIGANSTIDAGALNDTILADDVKLDKQVQIAHNVRVGRGVRIAAQSGVAGSSSIGAWCVIGGHVGVAGHLTLGPKSMVAAMSGVTKSFEAPGSVVAGMPAVPIQQWRQQMAALALTVKRGPKPTSAAPTLPKAAVPQPPHPESKTALPIGPDTANPFIPGEVY
jgi:UDP-3-O-[3-hydroxymyristoyl] glucosamine N-acyltransferase